MLEVTIKGTKLHVFALVVGWVLGRLIYCCDGFDALESVCLDSLKLVCLDIDW